MAPPPAVRRATDVTVDDDSLPVDGLMLSPWSASTRFTGSRRTNPAGGGVIDALHQFDTRPPTAERQIPLAVV